jgi:DNA-binding transcriptional LysR family regulator
VDGLLLEEGIVLHPEFELATSDMIVQFALRNLGVGCVVKDFAQPYLDNGRLFALRFNKLIPHRHMCVVTNKNLPVTLAAGKMLELLA